MALTYGCVVEYCLADYYDAYDSTGEYHGPRMTPPPRVMRKGFDQEEEDFYKRPRIAVWGQLPYPCDRKADLYVLQQHRFIHGDDFMANGPTNGINCSRYRINPTSFKSDF